ncbi:MAG: hypothetical protein KDC07_08740 [Chitinophagaceae bacterium]|nr:hypothetical protein [Chitinophagaceae bacterium]MCB9044526.1 hypothetical protein [Chitinophagales bacterium]
MTSTALRTKLYDYIREADDKKLKAIYRLLEDDIEGASEWWKDKHMVAELEERYEALVSGKDKGLSKEELSAAIDKARKKKYG